MGQEFTMTMHVDVAKWGLGCGGLLSGFYLYSLVKSFKFSFKKKWSERTIEEKRTTVFQSATLSVFVLWILYVIINLCGKWFMKSLCHIRPPITQTAWVVSRSAVYYFFTIRCKIAFQGTPFAMSRWHVWVLMALITIIYGFQAGFYIGRSHLMIYFATYQICMPSYIFEDVALDTPLAAWHRLGDALIYIQLWCEAVLGVLLVGSYVYKLIKLQRIVNALDDSNNAEEMTSFLKVAKKQAKMAWIAYISSICLLYLAALYVMWAFSPWLDGIINLTCVFCTFVYAHNDWIYRNVCNCRGNRWVLYLFCFLCTPCNAPNPTPQFSLELEVKRVTSASKGTEKGDVSASPDVETTTCDIDPSQDVTITNMPISSASED